MITEQYVTFETAQLLKEAGFDTIVRTTYRKNEDGGWFFNNEITEQAEYNIYNNVINAPTQSLAARWLREVHNYAVCVWFSKDHEKWFYAHGDMNNIVFDTDYHISEYKYDSYEEALEAGLQEALKLIKK